MRLQLGFARANVVDQLFADPEPDTEASRHMSREDRMEWGM